ncbi:MAG: ABC-F family ATP-binding cassette domain-containing protein [Treponema sp.]|jgi:ATP-binding cassette subfamily F protein 3|nr:ABC-F family ATP-binding cassette domain-containing protein [Treponema sp.]
MAFVQFTRVSLAFADRDILKEVGLNLASGSRAALAGANGSGKSTLMKVIAGKLTADSGERAVQKGSRISYLPQSGIVYRGRTLREEAETAYGEIIALLGEMETIGKTLGDAKADDGRTAALLAEYHRLQEAVENSGYYNRDQSIAMVLSGMGFSPDDLDRPVEEFSGGWQMRIALAKTLLEAPDILLLDEPTNYLDIEARIWLEQWLKSFPGGCLLVSHDRYFLDVTVNEVYELFQGRLKRYAGNYTAYEQVRRAELENLLKRYAAQQEEIAKAEDLIRRFRYKATKAAMVQERIKKLEKMERIEIPESLKKISISFPPPPHSGRIAMTLEGIAKSYGYRPVLGGIDLILETGEKLVVVGRNGAGKTTLLRILAGEDQDFTGKLSYGAGIQPGYFSQDAAETMYGSPQVLEYLEAEAPTELIPRIRDMLGAFLFRGDDVYKPISVLSGGEKSRLALLRMLLKPMNLLILDEPTNHLDLHSKDILLDTLKAYNGTIIFVSHDRAFMEALSTKTLELSPRGSEQAAAARLFYGGYGYYLDRIARESTDSITVENSTAAAPAEPLLPEKSPKPAARNSLPGSILIKAAERRDLSKQRQTLIRRLEREEGDILKALEKLEAEKAALETELARPEVYSSGEKARAVTARLNGVTAELEAKGREWEAAAAELARAKNGPPYGP